MRGLGFTKAFRLLLLALLAPATAFATPTWVLTQTIVGSGNSQIGWHMGVNGSQWFTDNAAIGGAQFFSSANGQWSLSSSLTKTSSYTNLGDISAYGTLALVGEPGDDSTIASQAELFSNSGGVWTSIATLTPSNNSPFNSFGTSVALNSSSLLIGSPNFTSSGGGSDGQGAVVVYTSQNAAWNQTETIQPAAGYNGDQFGWSLALSGSNLLVGEPGAIGTSSAMPGHAYLYANANNGTWTQTAELTPSDSTIGDGFGASIALSGNESVVTDLSNAYVFNGSTQVKEFTGISPQFVTIGDGMIAITAVNPNKQNIGGGEVQLYDATNFNSVDTIIIPTCGTVQNLCNQGSVYVPRFDGNQLLVGSASYQTTPSTSTTQGAVYAYSPADLSMSVKAPSSVSAGTAFQETVTATNDATAASPAFTVNFPAPTGASVSGTTNVSGGTCTLNSSGGASCKVNSIAGNGGTAQATFDLKATGSAGSTISTSAAIANSNPSIQGTQSIQIKSTAGGGGSSGGSSGGGSFALLGLLALASLAALRLRYVRNH